MEVEPKHPSVLFQCVSVDPLFNTPIKLLVHDILHNLTTIAGSKTMFLYKTHPANQVNIVGVVTSLKIKQDAVQCSIDDGTGSIQCFCMYHSLAEKDDLFLSVSKRMQQRLWPRQKLMKLGDILHVCGSVKQGLWNSTLYLSYCKWSVLCKSNEGLVWLKHFQDVDDLNKNVYSKPFLMNDRLQEASKSLTIHEIYIRLIKAFQPVLDNVVGTSTYDYDNFFGFELLDMPEMQSIVQSSLKAIQEHDTSFACASLSKQDEKQVAVNALAATLHPHVAAGRLIKKRCLAHEARTNNDQMDARYFVTTRCSLIIRSVQTAIAHLRNVKTSVSACTVLKVLDAAEFNFLKSSKHGISVVKVVMDSIERDLPS